MNLTQRALLFDGGNRLPETSLLLYLGRPNLEAADVPLGDDTEIGDDTIIRWMFLLPADADIRSATGWVSGVGNIFYDAAGDPIDVFASEIADWEDINRYNVLFHLVSEDTETGRLAIYALDADHATLNKARRVLREDQYDYLAPLGAILHYDAEISPLTELVGGVHTLDYSVLEPQYQRLADGSYINVGAQPAVDVLEGGIKGLRTCGAVTNLIPNPEATGAAVGVLPTGWTKGNAGGINADIVGSGPSYIDVRFSGVATVTARAFVHFTDTTNVTAVAGETFTASANATLIGGSLPPAGGFLFRISERGATGTTLVALEVNYVAGDNIATRTMVDAATAYCTSGYITNIGTGKSVDFTIRITHPQLTKTTYPQPFCVGTQSATYATASNGIWLYNPDGSELWQALTGSPFTLATRILMGVGSADLPNSSVLNICTPDDVSGRFLTVQKSAGGALTANLNDGTNNATVSLAAWSRGATLDFFLQVVTTNQMMVGYKVSTDASITWGSAATHDGSFGPDAVLSRLMLSYNNPYPLRFHRITAWKRQVPVAELEAWA